MRMGITQRAAPASRACRLESAVSGGTNQEGNGYEMGIMRVLSARSGDDRYTWNSAAVVAGDPEALAAVREAERIFAETLARGATGIKATTSGRALGRIHEFDGTAEQIILIPRVVGG
jgi:hypothetical protein